MRNIDLVIIGGGPSGMAAAISAFESGTRDILILERDVMLGGILNQCIHCGFGLHKFKTELSGPEYALRYADKVREYKINVMLDTMVLNISDDKVITATNSIEGVFQIKAKAVILAMGCRERTRGAIGIVGTRPSGVYTAGLAQKYVNMKGYLPGKKIVILGSGDIGLIMARRMTLEGASVLAVLELMPFSNGLIRNIVQCLNDYNIPLMLSHTIIKIHGKERVEGVTIAKVDADKKPILETSQYIECDTILLSVGLVPENELTQAMGIELDKRTNGAIVDEGRRTEIDGVFACGNVLHVHDLADYASEEAEIAGKSASNYILHPSKRIKTVKVINGENISHVVPQLVSAGDNVSTEFMFRVRNEIVDVSLNIYHGETCILTKKLRKVAPGEMEKVTINAGKLAKFTDDIKVEIVKN